ncbi:MAG: hypothetical protein KA954_13990 [Chitinophagales bacterium]|nr:hypothetical protein [Chitinophagales bacterium]MBP8752664.1 hypothetical protein [Chitinophagales bacterium]MBP9188518.1 hypothetical protein [Chitinophagales bacterium]MBP9547551.1 hypothetical protein [Chitinophagales bacterium]MBP9703214.1 hypothetical protein [Chitinophagales bacterium]
MHLIKYYFLFAVGLFLLVRCSSALYMPVAADEVISGNSLDSLITGRNLYISKCASCHSLYLPKQYTLHQWEINVEEMEEKAKLNSTQKELIFNYLVLNCKLD